MAETVGAVSGTKSDLSVSPASAKGSGSASVVQGALGGSARGGGLAYASKYRYQRHTWAHFLKQWWVSPLFGMAGLISLKESRPPGLSLGQKVLRSLRQQACLPWERSILLPNRPSPWMP